MKPMRTWITLVVCLFFTLLVAPATLAQPPVPHSEEENGISYNYWGMFLRDEFGIAADGTHITPEVLKVSKELGLIEKHMNHISPNVYNGYSGLGIRYRPGQQFRDRLPPIADD